MVYVGVSTPYHVEACELFLARGKAVLCEKPLAPTAAPGRRRVAAARASIVFFAEGLWTRAMPAARALRRLLVDERAIGDVVAVQCDTGFASRRDDARMPRATCGGMGLDMGVHASSFALLPLRRARRVRALGGARGRRARRAASTLDAAAASLEHRARRAASRSRSTRLYTSVRRRGVATVTYTGTAGSIRVHGLAHVPHVLSVGARARSRTERETEVLEFARDDDDGAHAWNYPGSIGLLHQARAVSDAVRDGAREPALDARRNAREPSRHCAPIGRDPRSSVDAPDARGVRRRPPRTSPGRARHVVVGVSTAMEADARFFLLGRRALRDRGRGAARRAADEAAPPRRRVGRPRLPRPSYRRAGR